MRTFSFYIQKIKVVMGRKDMGCKNINNEHMYAFEIFPARKIQKMKIQL